MELFRELADAFSEGKTMVYCLITRDRGSTPRKAGSRMLVKPDGSICGSIGGGATEYEVIQKALAMKSGDSPIVLEFELSENNDKSCGGWMEVYLEILSPADRLWIVGAGHVGKAAAALAQRFNFQIRMIDNRQGIFLSEEFKNYDCKEIPYEKWSESPEICENDFVVIATHDHSYDLLATATALKCKPSYLGVIASANKSEKMKHLLIESYGFAPSILSQIEMPIGIPMATATPDEIALSIVASLVDKRNRRKGLKPKKINP